MLALLCNSLKKSLLTVVLVVLVLLLRAKHAVQLPKLSGKRSQVFVASVGVKSWFVLLNRMVETAHATVSPATHGQQQEGYKRHQAVAVSGSVSPCEW